MQQKIMIIEDDRIMRVTLEDYLKASGYDAHAYEKGTDGVNAFQKGEFSLVVTDVRLPDMDGLDVLKAIKEKSAATPVLIMTAFGTIKDAVDAIKIGAFDYITKPFSLEEFNLIVKRGLEVKSLRDGNAVSGRKLPDCYTFPNIIGKSTEMGKIYDLIEKVSQTNSTVLILGENGTGKELVASTIHYNSRRKSRPLIIVNCAALPENLVESELFGHEKGAFTGAAQRKPGRFERADKGTIFLDEIGDLPASVQIKLLRVLQDGTFERLGGTETLKVDVRVIAATNKDLHKDVKTGRFREDLYYRLNVIPIMMPALRDRREDIPLLTDHFLECCNSRFGRSTEISSDAIYALMEYDFPGNVRELQNIVERSVALSTDNTITKNSLPLHIAKNQMDSSPTVTLSEVASEAEKEHIMKILHSTRGNKTKAAAILGISRKTLWEKIKAFNME
jgi:DNA-binding NtrC family response regulator